MSGIDFDFGGLSNAQLRLFAVRCARRVQHLMADPRSLAALDVAERYARGEATDKELAAARDAAWDAAAAASAAALAAEAAATAASRDAADAAAAASAAALAAEAAAWDAERAEQRKILDDIRSAP